MRIEVDAQNRAPFEDAGGPEMQSLTSSVIGAAITIHRALGPGFVEAIYENALCIELDERDISFERQLGVSVFFREVELGFHRLDLLVDGVLVVELKAIERLGGAHFATVRSYLRAFDIQHGLILNFGRTTLDIKRVAALPKTKNQSSLSPFPRFPRPPGRE